MDLSDEEMEVLLNYLEGFEDDDREHQCALCGDDEWWVDPALFELRKWKGATRSLKPVVPITCANCGRMELMSGLKVGLVDEEGNRIHRETEEPEEEGADSEDDGNGSGEGE